MGLSPICKTLVVEATMNRIAINIGNSRTSCGHFRDGKLAEIWDYSTSDMINASAGIAERVHTAKETELVVCSVVPSATKKMKRCLSELEIEVFQITAQSQTVIYGHYPAIGDDRIATASGALERFPDEKILLVFDFGTATTLTAVD